MDTESKIYFISNNLKIIYLPNGFFCRPRSGMAETVYFFYSFGFILARTIAVSLYAAWINDESRKPLEVLHSIPSEFYCTEVRMSHFIFKYCLNDKLVAISTAHGWSFLI